MSKKSPWLVSLVFLAAIACTRQMANESMVNSQSTGNAQPAAGNLAQIPTADAGPTSAPTPEKVEQINTDPAKLAAAFYEYYVDGFPRIDDERVVFARFL